MSAFVDTNVLVRHLTGDPADMATWATSYLQSEPQLFLTDLVVTETVYILESFYEAPRVQGAEAARSLLAMRSVVSVDAALLLRAIEVYETDRLDFAEAYLVACAASHPDPHPAQCGAVTAVTLVLAVFRLWARRHPEESVG